MSTESTLMNQEYIIVLLTIWISPFVSHSIGPHAFPSAPRLDQSLAPRRQRGARQMYRIAGLWVQWSLVLALLLCNCTIVNFTFSVHRAKPGPRSPKNIIILPIGSVELYASIFLFSYCSYRSHITCLQEGRQMSDRYRVQRLHRYKGGH